MEMNEMESNANSGEHQQKEKDVNSEKINIELRNHQQDAGDWDNKALAKELHTWGERFVVEFKLQCSVPALKLDQLRSSRGGHFRFGRNGFGLLNEIAINIRHINRREVDFGMLGTLLHELIHAEQQTLGTEGKASRSRNYHNRDFIDRAETFGLIVDHRGHEQYEPPPTRFSKLLARYGIQFPDCSGDELLEGRSPDIKSGNSKLKPWICGCKPRPIHVQVAVADFRARCLKCGELFKRKHK